MMGTSFINLWAEAVLEQMWICCQITGVVAKSLDAELLSNPQALAHQCLHPSEPRWNPLEFHGKRRSIGDRDCRKPNLD